MILPPAVDVVRNQASTLKSFGDCWGVAVAPKPADVPLKVEAASGSPVMAPPDPRATPLPRVRSLPPMSANAVLPDGSPSGQWSVAPSAATAVTYGRGAATPEIEMFAV